MLNRRELLASLSALAPLTLAPSTVRAADTPIRVLVWDEQQPAQKQAYDNFLGNAIAAHLEKQPGLRVISANLQQPDQGLPGDLLDNTDVLIWWGHVRHQEIPLEKAQAMVARIQAGRLALVALHSAHWARPFVEAMNERTKADARRRFPDPPTGPPVTVDYSPYAGGFVPTKDSLLTPAYYAMRSFNGQLAVRVDLPNCVFPAYRGDGQPSQTRVLLPEHPLAAGIPREFTIPQTEMYDEPFHVPEPDEVVFEETWKAGERFRSGCIWKLGAGRVFYYRPGHETYPVYRQEIPLRIVENAARWLGSTLVD
jgi:trehalose utilization protein